MVAAAIIVPLFAIWAGRSAWRKPNAGARLAALLGLIIACWFILAAGSPSGAGLAASDVARGLVTLTHSIGVFLGQF